MDFAKVLALIAAMNREGVEYITKRDTVRPKDRIDAEWLRHEFGFKD